MSPAMYGGRVRQTTYISANKQPQKKTSTSAWHLYRPDYLSYFSRRDARLPCPMSTRGPRNLIRAICYIEHGGQLTALLVKLCFMIPADSRKSLQTFARSLGSRRKAGGGLRWQPSCLQATQGLIKEIITAGLGLMQAPPSLKLTCGLEPWFLWPHVYHETLIGKSCWWRQKA